MEQLGNNLTPNPSPIERGDDDEEYTECPNCGAVWGIEELSFQECDYCGYPACDDDENIDYDDFDEE